MELFQSLKQHGLLRVAWQSVQVQNLFRVIKCELVVVAPKLNAEQNASALTST